MGGKNTLNNCFYQCFYQGNCHEKSLLLPMYDIWVNIKTLILMFHDTIIFLKAHYVEFLSLFGVILTFCVDVTATRLGGISTQHLALKQWSLAVTGS